ncbi:hypothetical protein DFP72DRAFT_855297 [Ephemerocybe angulata]|uniref:Uncharacterized protein n=1 Tax=Ephemerocybe angulata TaxID=980116 RepID=A0A8H6HGJ4_9AGAR|nr:hypothetical protein DFP72DRAFT_855297 [Tulosesus angulatus]
MVVAKEEIHERIVKLTAQHTTRERTIRALENKVGQRVCLTCTGSRAFIESKVRVGIGGRIESRRIRRRIDLYNRSQIDVGFKPKKDRVVTQRTSVAEAITRCNKSGSLGSNSFASNSVLVSGVWAMIGNVGWTSSRNLAFNFPGLFYIARTYAASGLVVYTMCMIFMASVSPFRAYAAGDSGTTSAESCAECSSSTSTRAPLARSLRWHTHAVDSVILRQRDWTPLQFRLQLWTSLRSSAEGVKCTASAERVPRPTAHLCAPSSDSFCTASALADMFNKGARTPLQILHSTFRASAEASLPTHDPSPLSLHWHTRAINAPVCRKIGVEKWPIKLITALLYFITPVQPPCPHIPTRFINMFPPLQYVPRRSSAGEFRSTVRRAPIGVRRARSTRA